MVLSVRVPIVAAVLLGCTLQPAPAASDPPADGYFLSPTNPLATTDQRDFEQLALKVIATPELQKARETIRAHWKTIVGKDMIGPEGWAMFDSYLDDYVMHFTLQALNADPNYPRIVRVNNLPHDWFGMHVPGSRQGGGDNPDNTYALIPIEHGAHYEITGKRLQPLPADVTYTLAGDLTPMMTLGTLTGDDIKSAPDGSFKITIGPDAANGQSNYLQTQPESKFLFIRESRSDWRQVPSAIQVRRLDPPHAPPLTFDQQVARAARYVVADVPDMYWWLAIMAELPVNEMTQPFNIGKLGGLVSQDISFGHFKLKDDEALVITVGPGTSKYHNIVLHDAWYRTLPYDTHTSDFTNSQTIPNADGTTTYVASVKDPGVYNWLDTAGLHDLLVCNRWQGLSASGGPQPTMSSKLVKLADLAAALPAGMKHVTPAERATQLAQRNADFRLRFVDH